MKSTGKLARAALALLAGAAMIAGAGGVMAQQRTEIHWWHAMGGARGELLNDLVAGFNKGQDKYTVVATNKGNYAEIGRASCRERVCQYVTIAVVAGSLKKKT